MILPLSMAAPAAARAKNPPPVLLVMEQMRTEAGEQMRAAFPGALKRYGLPLLPPSTISKARLAYVCCPAFRAALCILALRVGGADRARAQRIVDWLQSWIERLWPEEEAKPAREVVPEHQAADAEEDMARTAYLTGAPGGRERFLAAVQRCHALAPTLIEALEAEGGR